MRYFLTFLFFISFYFLFIFQLHAVRIFGKVTSSEGENMPFLTVYEEGTTYGTTTNQEGEYFLELSEGEHQIIFRYVGVESQRQTVTIKSTPKNTQNGQESASIELNVIMQTSPQELKEVVINSSSENSASTIISSAQNKREFYKTQNKAFSCDVYIKNVQYLDKLELPKILENEGIKAFRKELERNNISYFSESVSKYYFLAPNKRKEVVISSKISGDRNGLSWNSAFYLSFDIYENTILLPIGDRPFVSPIAAGAKQYYDYQYEGKFIDNDITVHKIRVLPHRKGQPLFGGFIYIQDSTWRVHSLDLEVSKDAGIEFIDKLTIKQTFVPVSDKIWLRSTQSFLFTYSIAAAKAKLIGHGNYVGSFSNYDTTPIFTEQELEKNIQEKNQKQNQEKSQEKHQKVSNLDSSQNQKIIPERHFFTNNISIVLDSANFKSTEYWKNNRLIPLTDKEKNHYLLSDSTEEAHQKPAHLDAVDKKVNKFKLPNLLFGYNYRITKKELTYNFLPLIQNIQMNVVEGYVLNLGVGITKFRERNFSTTRANLNPRYGFSSKKFYMKGDFFHQFNEINDAFVYFEGGTFVQQFDINAITPIVNGIYTAVREENYLKIYEKRFAKFTTGKRIFDGTFLRVQAAFENRVPLYNAMPLRKALFDREGLEYTPNLPTDFDGNNVFCESHKAFILSAELTYKIGEKYILRPKERAVIENDYPIFTLTYTQAIPNVFESKADFGKLTLNIQDDIRMGILGSFNYEAQTGTFLWNNYTSFIDYAHFQTSPLLFVKSDLKQFLLLPFYTYSTTNTFAEFHAEQHFNGYLMKKIPVLKKLNWQFVAGLHYLYTKNTPHYTEASIGIERIVKVLRVDAVWSVNPTLENNEGHYAGKNFGVRLSLGI